MFQSVCARLGFAVMAASVFLTMASFATRAEAAAASDQPTTQLTPIEVTGSRLGASSVAGANPVFTINRAQIDASGFTQLGDLINSLVFTGAAQNTHWNANGTGRVQVDIHNLGSQRVLVLVNGQRWITTVGGPVDLSTIPLEVVERVEVLLDGASAIYGSDAISGVINIITVKNFVGAEATGEIGSYDAHGDGGGWDGKMQGESFLLGTANDRSSVSLGAGYYNSNPVYAGNRDISRYPVAGFGNLLGSPITPDGHLIFDTNDPGPFGDDCTSGTDDFGYHCDLAGPLTGPNANPHPFTNADLYNDAADTYIQTPQERWYLYSQGHYDLTDNIEFSFMTTYERRNATELTPPNPWAIGSQGSIKVNGLPVGISGTNAYNPFGIDLVPAAPGSSTFDAWCSQWGTGEGGGCTDDFAQLDYLGIRPLAQGSQTITQNLQNFYFNGGFDGSFTLFDNPWHWNANYSYGQSLEAEIRDGLTLAAPLQYGLGPAQICDTTPACVPLNVFGGSAGVTPAMLAYTDFTAHFISQAITRDYNANIGGGFFNSWYAGPWQAAAGYEYVADNGLFEPDAAVIKGLWTGFAIQPQYGRKNSNAQYGEVGIPFAKGLPFAKSISLDLAERFTQAKWDGQPGNAPTVGGQAHASTGRVALKWEINDQVLLRGSWSQGFRVPSISELFSSNSIRPQALIDPCVANQNLPPDQQQNLPNCPDNGHGGASQPNPSIPVTSGGNPNLNPERSITRSAGVVWSPQFAPGLDFSADYYKIEIVDAVSVVGAQALLDGCYLSSIVNYCSQVDRSNGIIQNVLSTNYNAGSLHTNGWDLGINYKLPETPVGVFTVAFSANFTRFLTQCNIVETNSGARSLCNDSAGSVAVGSRTVNAVPKQLMNLGLGWNYGNWSAQWNVYLIGRMYEQCSDSLAATLSPPPWSWCSNNANDTNELGTTVYNDVQGSYTVAPWNTTFTLGVQNILDRDPPIAMTYSPGMFLPVYYRIPGRFFYASASIRF